MSEGSRPEFEAPDQQLDGADRTAGEVPAEAPEASGGSSESPADTGESRWRAVARKPWALGAGVLAVVVLGGVAWALSGAGGESEPVRFTSLPAEPCSLVPGGTLEQHVPNSDVPVPSKADNSATERYVACEWAEPLMGAAGVKTLTAHRLNVAVRLHLDGAAQAKSEYDAAWSGARAMAGTADGAAGSLRAEAPTAIGGIGDQAFTHHSTLKGPLGQSGTVAATVRVRNAVITVRYRGTTSPLRADGSPKPGASAALDEGEARAGAEAIARSVTATLTACARCLSDG